MYLALRIRGRLEAYNRSMADEEEDKFGYYRDHFTWSMRQAEALRKRDLDAIDWENVSEKIEDFGKGEWLDCLEWCLRLIERLLLIEYYPAERDRIRLWRDCAIGSILELENEGRRSSSSGSINKEITDRWEALEGPRWFSGT